MSVQLSDILSPQLAGMVDALAGSLNGVRRETWKLACVTAVWQQATRFIETGCYRGTAADGCSTVILAQLAKDLGGHVDSYELSLFNIHVAVDELRKFGLLNYVTFHQGDSVLRLAERSEPIDFAYLDSYDCGSGPDYTPCQQHQLAEFEAILPLFSQRACVLLDDNISEVCNKTALTMKRLDNLRWDKVAAGYQVLYSSEDTQALTTHKIAVLAGHLREYAPLAAHTLYRNRAQYCLRHSYDLRILRGVHAEFQDPKTHANGFSWARLKEMLRLVESGVYEWVWCVGADTLVTNFGVTLESIIAMASTPGAEDSLLPLPPAIAEISAPPPVIKWVAPLGHQWKGKKHLLICGERVAPMQADSFLVKCSPEGAAYLRDILRHYPSYKHHPWVENQTMIDLREKYAAITFMVPQHVMNAYDYRRFEGIHPCYKDGTDCFGNRGQWQKGDFLVHWPAATLEQRMKWLAEYSTQIVK